MAQHLLLLSVSLAALLELACAGGGGMPSASLGAPVTERFPLPADDQPGAGPWKLASQRHGRDGLVATWVPADQDPKTASDVLTREIAYRRNDAPTSYADELARRIAQRCEVAQTQPSLPGTESGYDVAYGAVTCFAKDSGRKNEYALVKAIRGHEALYSAIREFRYEPSAAQIHEANEYLAKRVYLCSITAHTDECEKASRDFE